ncbi:type IV secretion system protein VirB3 [Endobacter medicaginis]|uniref:Type IV secretion system protein VirB3 n=1 Tax=Endobacter medicaginis TaxID=1181271 RepID=A0A850NM41_9PROT|nr:type IV secretion system protein VirB3 [Endobacter medicaginis]MBB3175240.1 type IV secretion system protein VirB3 [Endobacter medicaginis]MCX5476276.1 type IV secretion system protein VirB3 [Endobacter medicaginis]NVN28966.1 type IV secretion system protein VirB3 [Endobacter medicaginis]
MEKLEEETLYLAATRPALFMGIPLSLAGVLVMAAGLVVVIFKNPLYLILMGPIYGAARILVARDYNAVRVVGLWFRTKGRKVDKHVWGGSTVSNFPLDVPKSGRGIV